MHDIIGWNCFYIDNMLKVPGFYAVAAAAETQEDIKLEFPQIAFQRAS